MSKTSKWKLVTSDLDKCVGCQVCEYICAFAKDQAFNPFKSRIRVVNLTPPDNLAVTCRLCNPAPCVLACPRDALTQSEETGVIMVDDDKCDGCGWCIEACDYGAITLHPNLKVVRICDLCDGKPKCVEWCPEGALDFANKEILAQKARRDVVKKLLQGASETRKP